MSADFSLEPQQLPDRRPLDKYRTPPLPTQALIQHYPEIRGDLVIDPCAGDCRMPRALIEAGRFCVSLTNDIDANEPTDAHEDATTADFWSRSSFKSPGRRKWVCTNPPFILATSIAWHAIQTIGNVALLLRSTWLEPAEDRQWLERLPPRAELVLPRFSFIGGGGTDSAGCRWYIWGDVPPGIRVCARPPGQQELAL